MWSRGRVSASFCLVALKGEYLWAWSNTCCIGKESSVGLQGAIGSMFIRYQESNLAIAYLTDLSENDTLVGN
ncbi:hypothetical protein EDD15DRAFT_2341127, partial [Pisolithus albus]